MADNSTNAIDKDTMPFVAPCRKLSPLAPFGWLKKGVADLGKAPQQGLTYGFFMALIMASVVWLAWARGSQYIMLAMLGGFVFIAPLSCIGLYAISAQLERGQEPSMARSLRAAFKRHIGNELIFAIALLVIFMVWSRAALMITVFFPIGAEPDLESLLPFLTIGTIVGAFFAIVTFSASAFSLPMIMHRDVDSITAIVTSVNAVLRNKFAMLLWLALIMAGLLIGFLTAFVGLIVILPVIGFGAWHGYLETIQADQFPRHAIGITATPRTEKT
ncbi:MAG: DUF2189 domain-containing protein [Gammaproteobacteria bacterium]|nr:DUF2189 domain-containing protein [Gammaproteobacteria bacterium]